MKFACVLILAVIVPNPSKACELCAIYSASNARGESGRGFLISVSEQYGSQGTLQFEGEEFGFVSPLQDAFLDTSLTHIVPAYNFSSRFGVSLSVPIMYRDFRRIEISSFGELIDESGTEFGLGDVAFIARFAPIQKQAMSYSVQFNLLAGLKVPTGDTDRLDQEVAQAERDRDAFGPEHPHSSFGGIHQHDLSLGSGSYDGVFGTAFNARWKRFFVNQQFQYYLRTEANGYRFGDLFIASGGPGAYLLLHEGFTISLQGSVYYEWMQKDELIGQENIHTGLKAWYAGPQLNFTIGEHFSLNAAVDIPLSIDNNGLQTVLDYRAHGGITWRF